MKSNLIKRCLTAIIVISLMMAGISYAGILTQASGSDANASASQNADANSSSASDSQNTDSSSASNDRSKDNNSSSSEKAANKMPLIAVDAGHQQYEDHRLEKEDPDKSRKKIRNTSGCSGAATGMPEYKYTLNIAKNLKKELEKRGYRVYMTRTKNKVKISNKKRALRINKLKADACIRIHCDSFGSSASGASMQYRSKPNSYISKALGKKNKRLSKCILKKYCKATKMKNRGIAARTDLTGCNWANVPTTLIEMGFFSNPREERKMQKASFQRKMIKGIADGFDAYFKVSGS